MRIKMKKTVLGSEDCFVLKRFYEGEEYDVADGLAGQFIRKGQAIKSESTIEDDVIELQLRCEYQLEFEKGGCPPSYDIWKIERQNRLAALDGGGYV